MSPIGRVFIVLNLALAAGFIVTSGQLLQNQANYKEMLQKEQKAHADDNQSKDLRIADLETAVGNAESAKSSFQNQLRAMETAKAKLEDDNAQLSERASTNEANLKRMTALLEAGQKDTQAAIAQAKDAYDAAIAAGKEKDLAVRAKDAAEAENRDLKTTIASLNDTIGSKDVALASMKKDNDELSLLVAAAKENGFMAAMASPTLAGTVTMASDRLVTIAVADNPGNVDIQDMIERNPFRIAIYDASGYKAEAVATKYEASANAILCNVMFKKDDAVIRTGDKASTKP